MKMIFQLTNVVLIALAGIFLSSCGEKQESDSSNVQVEENIADQLEHNLAQPEDDEDEYSFIPPSPLQVASIFKKAGLFYDDALAYSPDKAETFSTKFEQSLAFGIYSSDLAYSVKNEEYTEASEYLKALRTLGNKIGLETVFNSEDIVDRFETNIGNQDSIIDILIYVQENTDNYIEENGKDDLAVIYYTGAWIEGMFLGAKTVMEKGDQKLSVLISEQITIAEILATGLEHVKDRTDDIIDLNNEVNDIIETFNGFESVTNAGEDVDYLEIELNKNELELISGKIIDLRESFLN